MAIHRLSAAKVANAKPGKYEDGGGLRLVVSKRGSSQWVFRYSFYGKRREMGLGSTQVASLAQSRVLAQKCRQMVALGEDPIEANRSAQKRNPTFTECAAAYILGHRSSWKSRKHAKQWVATLKTYARPVIGDKQVDRITTEDILKILKPIWNTKTETAKRVQGRIENVLDFASAHSYRDTLNPARWRGHLDKLLPAPSRVKKLAHHPAMPYSDLPRFLAELSDIETTASQALRLLILTATRSGEVLNATWSEFNLEESMWVIPAERMKAGAEHRIPLPKDAIKLLRSLPRSGVGPHVFPGHIYGKPISNMAMIQLMRRLGYGNGGKRGPYVPHGFRSSFRDWAGETSNFPSDVIEMALAHTIQNKVEAAYRRGDLFLKRRRLMDEWNAHLISVSTTVAMDQSAYSPDQLDRAASRESML
jgi:integrase